MKPRAEPPDPAWRSTECDGKQRFDSAERAHQVAARSRKRRTQRASAYRCAHCGGWHIGSSALRRTDRDEVNRTNRRNT